MLILELRLRVTYNPNGVSEAELRGNLETMVQHAFGDGWITGDSPAEVEKHSMQIETLTEPKEGVVCLAEVHSDDWRAKTSFDALPWLQQASAEEVIELAKCDWGGDYPADVVAQFMVDCDEQVCNVMNYVAMRDGVGFEVHVDEGPALHWLQENRPSLAILAEYGGECPDCAEAIPPTVQEGEECANCGHVFCFSREDDDQLRLPRH